MRDEDGSYLAYAKRPIKKGEEVCSMTSPCLEGQKADRQSLNCTYAFYAGRVGRSTPCIHAAHCYQSVHSER